MQQYEGTVIAVTHDRYFLDDVSEWILELDRGEGIPWKGNYSSWLDQKTKRMEQEEKSASKRRKTLERELEWVWGSASGKSLGRDSKFATFPHNFHAFPPFPPRNGRASAAVSALTRAIARFSTCIVLAKSLSLPQDCQ